jgi:AcrR family transcriptional regulator
MKKLDFEDFNTPYPKGTRFNSTRGKIIGTALRIIANDGGEVFSLNELLRRSQISKGSFFHHFKNLDALCLECFEECKNFTAIDFGQTNAKSIFDLLNSFGDETLKHTTSHQFLRIVMFFGMKAMSDERYQDKQRELTELYVEGLSDLILKFEPKLKVERVREAVSFLLVVNQGIAGHRVLFKNRERMSRVWPHAVEASLRIMRGTETDAGEK